ncbi:hypothetical protein AHiyo4_08140 [Arthrobacter sp. Hiyo4]|nr:hypothetical protein AHiyo4_08140 [Arthrobacter sp. Hiyo4]
MPPNANTAMASSPVSSKAMERLRNLCPVRSYVR